LLTLLPVFDKFRWPFKVYLLADFFLIASFVWTVDLRTKSPLLSAWRANLAASVCLTILMLANFAISFAFHDKSTFSETVLPASFNPVAPGMDPLRGRVATFAKDLPDSQAHHYLSHAYATYFAFPSLGGYNPLVGHASLAWALFLDFPNYCRGTITPDFRKDFVARSVRYWIVDSHSPQLQQIEALPGFRQLESDANRVVFEDTQGLPIAYSNADPPTPCAMTYSGNSILISLAHATSPVEVSFEPTDGWWYRVDHGRWLKPVYQDDRLQIDFQTNGQILEVSYFDPPFRQGLLWSTVLLLLFCLLLVVNHSSFKAKNALPHE